MRKLVLAVAVVVAIMFVVTSCCFAENFLEKLPGLKQGVMYNWQDNEFEHLSSIECASWKNITFELGYLTESSIVGVISYPLLKLKDLGVTLPILDLIEFNVGVCAGVSRIGNNGGNNEAIYGITFTLIDIKFG